MTAPLYAIGRFRSRHHWLDRIVPHVSIEGEDYFAKRDAEAAKSSN